MLSMLASNSWSSCLSIAGLQVCIAVSRKTHHWITNTYTNILLAGEWEPTANLPEVMLLHDFSTYFLNKSTKILESEWIFYLWNAYHPLAHTFLCIIIVEGGLQYYSSNHRRKSKF